MKERVYVIKYKLFLNGDNKYLQSGHYDERVLYFSGREEFIKRYKELKEKVEQTIYYDNLQCFAGRLEALDDIEERIAKIEKVL